MGNTRPGGVYTPVVTPFHDDLSLDVERFVAHCRWLTQQEAGLAIFGTNSEANSLSLQERHRLLDALVEGGIAPDLLLPGVGCCSLPETIELTRHAVQIGAAGVLMLPPFFFKPVTDNGLIDYFSRVVDEVASDTLQVLLYHIPQYTGVPITLGVIEGLLSRYPNNIVGVKDSSGNWQNTEAMLNSFPDFAIFPASESLLSKALPLGAAGCISATANINPAAISRFIRSWRHDGLEGQQALDTIRKTFEGFPMIAALKTAIADQLDDSAWLRLRPPLEALNDAQHEALSAALACIHFKLAP